MDQAFSEVISFPVNDIGLMDTSFEENLSEEHARAIWNASVQFLKSTLTINFDDSKGFNDENILESNMEFKDSITEKTDPQEILNKNAILNNK